MQNQNKTFVLRVVKDRVINATKYSYGIKLSQYVPQYEFDKQSGVNAFGVAHALIFLNGVLTIILEGQWLELSSSGTGVRVWDETDLLYNYTEYVPVPRPNQPPPSTPKGMVDNDGERD